jgi:hypothetical protein
MDKITQAIKVLAALDSSLMNFQYLLGTKAVPSPDDPHKYFWSNDAKATTIGHLEAERVILDLKDKLEDYLDRCTEISQQQAPSKTPQEMTPQE